MHDNEDQEIRSLKSVNSNASITKHYLLISQMSRMDRAKISQLFSKEISSGQHNCNKEDIIRNEKPLSLLLCVTLILSEDLGVSIPGWSSCCCNCAALPVSQGCVKDE